MNTTFRLIAVAVALSVTASCAVAESIWARGNSRTQNLTTDDKATEVGDVITIVIYERSTIANETTRDMSKSDSRSASMSGSAQLGSIGGPLSDRTFDFPEVDFGSSSDTSFSGDTEYDSDRSVSDRITVVVQDLLPNGNMVVQGQRSREIDGDSQTVQISGVVRPSDVGFDNTVRSDRVADFRVVYEGAGQEQNFTNPGWLGRLANFLNPF